MSSLTSQSFSRRGHFEFAPLRVATARPGLIFLVDQSALSNKTKRLLKSFIRLYQATCVTDFTLERLMELRGCGKGTAAEILNWIQSTDYGKK